MIVFLLLHSSSIPVTLSSPSHKSKDVVIGDNEKFEGEATPSNSSQRDAPVCTPSSPWSIPVSDRFVVDDASNDHKDNGNNVQS